MKALTKKESELLLVLCKDYATNYNANSLSKLTNITPRGALKMLKNLTSQHLLISKKYGKATFYKINYEDDYTKKLIATLLMQEAKEKSSRWIAEFKDISKIVELIILFGSTIKNPKKAKDVDVILVIKKKNYKKVMDFVEQKNRILLKPIHAIIQTPKDLPKNLKANAATLNAICEGTVLYGSDTLVEVLERVTSF
jgi:predicted nucleotidyltransferase